MPAALISAGIGAAGSIFGGNAAAKAQKAARAQQAAQYAQTRQDLQPYRDTGKNALNSWGDAQGFNGDAAQKTAWDKLYSNNPAFNGAVAYGTQNLQNAAFAKGTGFSGNLANQVAENANRMQYERGQNTLNQWYQGGQLGENAAAQTGNFGQQSANQISQSLTSQGQAQAASYQGAANAGVSGLNSYNQQQNFNSYLDSANTGKFGNPSLYNPKWPANTMSSVG